MLDWSHSERLIRLDEPPEIAGIQIAYDTYDLELSRLRQDFP